MQLYQMIVIFGILASNIQVLAKGINCKGSLKCDFINMHPLTPAALLRKEPELHANALVGYINSLNDTTWIRKKEPIACVGRICAFLKNIEGMYGREVKALAKEITKHGCKQCGSCPVGYPGNNDGREGELTFNYRLWACRTGQDGICPYFVWEEKLQGLPSA